MTLINVQSHKNYCTSTIVDDSCEKSKILLLASIDTIIFMYDI